MSSSGRVLDIARKALAAQQIGLSVAGQNIANVNTPGYSRQRVELQASVPAMENFGFVGQGVDVQSIQRERDTFIDSELRGENQSLNRWDNQEQSLSEIEGIFNEPSDSGLSSAMTNFWNSWGDLSNNPQNGAARESVRETGNSLASTFNQLHTRLTDLQSNLSEDLQNNINDINSKLVQVATLNEGIASTENRGISANDLRDKRDLLLQDLSGYADIQVVERKDGAVTLSLSGRILVEQTNVHKLGTKTVTNNQGTVEMPTWAEDGSIITPSNGTLKGIMETRDTIIPEQLKNLDDMAKGIVNKVNALQMAGTGLNGSTGIPFFDAATTGAANMALDSRITADVSKIAASADGNSNDGNNADAISNLQKDKFMSGDTLSVGDFFAAAMGKLGVQSKEATFMHENQQLMVDQLTQQQESVSGVSLDEEMTQLMKYQRAYEAAAKLVTSVDEMMQTVINMKQ
jgi:flagellar hook-associated protein 1 FlgK